MMGKRLGLAVSVCGLVLSLHATSARAQVVTLQELERKALHGRPAFDADAASESAANAEVRKARAAYYPSLALTAQSGLAPGSKLRELRGQDGETFLVSGVQPADESGAFDPLLRYGAGFELKTALYDFGRTSSAVEASRAKRKAVIAGGEVTKQAIIMGVRASYLAWLGASELSSVAARALTDAKERRMRVEALISEGVRPQSDLTPARSDELLAQLELDRAQGDSVARKHALEHAVGAPIGDGAVPDRALLEQRDVKSNGADPQRQALELERVAAQKAADAYAQADSPVLGAAAAAGIQGQSEYIFPNYSLGVSFSLPLWDGGQNDASADAARARSDGLGAKIREHEIDEAYSHRQAELDAASASKRIVTAELLLASCTAQLAEAEARYELVGGGLEAIAVARALIRRAHTEVVLAKIARAQALLR
jgi:outer membrane protein TolC